MPKAPDKTLTSSNPTDLKALDAEALEVFMQALGEPAFRGRQIYRWLYVHGARTFDEMTDLPASLRERLPDVATLSGIRQVTQAESIDGTVKTLYARASGAMFETVLIPDLEADGSARRLTVCVSSQVGCAMGCTFCATGRMGFRENLTSGEIFDQVFDTNVLALNRYGRGITNVVFMGMGEPLLNYDAVRGSILKLTDTNGPGMSARRITVSTVGLAGRIRLLADEKPACNLAVSLHAPTDEKRSAIMPVNRKEKTDLRALRGAVEYYTRATGQTVTYEYCLFKDFNDSDEDAARLADIVRWAPSKVNLIMYNAVEGVAFERTSESRVNRFMATLVEAGVRVTLRRSRGSDIQAACGQLASSG